MLPRAVACSRLKPLASVISSSTRNIYSSSSASTIVQSAPASQSAKMASLAAFKVPHVENEQNV
jgi:hypothetical protein